MGKNNKGKRTAKIRYSETRPLEQIPVTVQTVDSKEITVLQFCSEKGPETCSEMIKKISKEIEAKDPFGSDFSSLSPTFHRVAKK